MSEEEQKITKEETIEPKPAEASAEAEPAASESVKPEPAKPESVTSEPVKSEPVTSEPAKSEPITSESAKSEPVTSGLTKSESVTSEPAKSESEKSKTGRAASEKRKTGRAVSEKRKTGRAVSEDDIEELVFPDEEKPTRRFFRSHTKSSEEDRDRLILSTIKDEDLMEYLKLEQERLEFLQHAKDVREKRILSAFQLAVSLAAVVAIIYFLKDNPTILISILYIIGILAALWVWKNPRDRQDK